MEKELKKQKNEIQGKIGGGDKGGEGRSCECVCVCVCRYERIYVRVSAWVCMFL